MEVLAVTPHPDLPEDDAGSTLEPYRQRSGNQHRRQDDGCNQRNGDVERTLDPPRGPVKIGTTDPHDRNGADVIGQSGLGVEVMHPRNDEQVYRLALLGTHSVDQRAFLKVSIGDEERARISCFDRDIEISETA